VTVGANFRADMRLRRVARHLARWRAEAELTGVEVGRMVGFSQTKLSKLENAVQPISPADVMALALVYKVPADERDRVFRLAARSRYTDPPEPPGRDRLREGRQEYAELEARARSLRSYRSDQVPGLLQTGEYATAAAMGGHQHHSRVIAREQAERRAAQAAVLTRRGSLRVHAILDEAVLRRQVGGPRVMREQLLHLVELAELPTITIQVVPFEAGAHAASGASFDLLSFAQAHYPDLVYLEGLADTIYLETPEETDPYGHRFADARDRALGPRATVEKIAEHAGAF
jgi:transcriptional regulator with XRE-family HTH domain